MKKLACLVTTVLLLVSCVPSAESPTPVFTIIPSSTSTLMPVFTPTESPTATLAVPTATITPMTVVPVSSSPLTLTEFNAGTEMKRLNVIGTGTAQDIKFSPDGKLLAIATGRGVYFYDGKTFEQNNFIDVNASVSAIAFSPDGNILAMAIDGKASLWNVNSGQQIMNLDGGMVRISKLAYGRCDYVAAIGGDCEGCGSAQDAMILWNAKICRQIYSQHEIWFSTIALAFTSEGTQLIFGGRGGLTVIQSETGKQMAIYQTQGSRISAAIDAPNDFIFNKDGTQLFVTSFEESSEIFDITTQSRTPFAICDVYMASNGTYGACS